MENLYHNDSLPNGLRHLQLRTTDEYEKYRVPVDTVPRPGFNTTGKEIELSLNAYPILKFPNKTVHQYDVSDIYLQHACFPSVHSVRRNITGGQSC